MKIGEEGGTNLINLFAYYKVIIKSDEGAQARALMMKIYQMIASYVSQVLIPSRAFHK